MIGRLFGQLRARRAARIIDKAVRKGVDPVAATMMAAYRESGIPPKQGENLSDYMARAAGVSVDILEHAQAEIRDGRKPARNTAPAHAFLERIGRRLAS